MDQKTIIESLQKTLANATGSLDDLDKLLERVRKDVATAKKEEAERKAAEYKAQSERGQRVASIATRLLNSELTSDDIAYVFNIYFKQHKICEDMPWTAKDIEEIITKCKEFREDAEAKSKNDEQLTDVLNKCLHALDSLLAPATNSKSKKVVVEEPKNADDVINKFLKDFGLA